jgi:uncharacterized membrane protein SirB2
MDATQATALVSVSATKACWRYRQPKELSQRVAATQPQITAALLGLLGIVLLLFGVFTGQ